MIQFQEDSEVYNALDVICGAGHSVTIGKNPDGTWVASSTVTGPKGTPMRTESVSLVDALQPAVSKVIYARLKAEKTPEKAFHSFVIRGFFSVNGGQFLRVVGIWGDEDNYEGNALGPKFSTDDVEGAEKLCDELEALGMPISVEKVLAFIKDKYPSGSV